MLDLSNMFDILQGFIELIREALVMHARSMSTRWVLYEC